MASTPAKWAESTSYDTSAVLDRESGASASFTTAARADRTTASRITAIPENSKASVRVVRLRHKRGYSATNYDANQAARPKYLRCQFWQKYDGRKVRNNEGDKHAPPEKLSLAFATADVTLTTLTGWRLDRIADDLRDGLLLAVSALCLPATDEKRCHARSQILRVAVRTTRY